MVVESRAAENDTGAPAEPPGTGFVERYQLGDVIGQGSAATVYRAWDRCLSRDVAIKLYGPGTGTEGAGRPQHRAELAALARLRHPGLVALYDAGVHEDRFYLVLQLIDGEPLSRRIARGRLSVAAVVQTGMQLAGTLVHVHARGVIHRDIKPSNVLFDGSDRCFLTDFGVSRFVDTTRCTASGVALGTPAFLAPEQVRGERLGPAVDIYALGLLLLEALTGAREYPGGPVESAVARLHRRPQLPAALPNQLRTLLREMTAAQPAHRPDAADVVARLEAVPPSGRRVSRPIVVGSPRASWRRRWLARPVLAIGGVLAVAAAAALMADGFALPAGGPATRPLVADGAFAQPQPANVPGPAPTVSDLAAPPDAGAHGVPPDAGTPGGPGPQPAGSQPAGSPPNGSPIAGPPPAAPPSGGPGSPVPAAPGPTPRRDAVAESPGDPPAEAAGEPVRSSSDSTSTTGSAGAATNDGADTADRKNATKQAAKKAEKDQEKAERKAAKKKPKKS